LVAAHSKFVERTCQRVVAAEEWLLSLAAQNEVDIVIAK
jgi:hypothetical protein